MCGLLPFSLLNASYVHVYTVAALIVDCHQELPSHGNSSDYHVEVRTVETTIAHTTLSYGFLPTTPLYVVTVSPSYQLFFLYFVYCSPSRRLAVSSSPRPARTPVQSRRRRHLALYFLFFVHLALAILLPGASALLPFGFSLAFGLLIYLPSFYSRFSIFAIF